LCGCGECLECSTDEQSGETHVKNGVLALDIRDVVNSILEVCEVLQREYQIQSSLEEGTYRLVELAAEALARGDVQRRKSFLSSH